MPETSRVWKPWRLHRIAECVAHGVYVGGREGRKVESEPGKNSVSRGFGRQRVFVRLIRK
jgi:hypothetical protein